MDRSIIHLNIADFAVAVERGIDPRLNGRPVVISPARAARAAVYDMSDEAFQDGVRKGMALAEARRICPQARIVAPHPDRYERAMEALFKQVRPHAPIIEAGPRDGHFFLDVTGATRLLGPPMDIAWRLRRQLKHQLGLEPIWAVAPNKSVAKVATRLVKPTGEYIIAAGEEQAFLAPLPIGLIPGIEAADCRLLESFNLTGAGQVAQLSRPQLRVLFNGRAGFIYAAVRGQDAAPVFSTDRQLPKIVIDHDWETDTNDARQLNRALYGMIESAGRKLRRIGRAAQRAVIVLDYSDGPRRFGMCKINPASANDPLLYAAVHTAMHRVWTRRVRIRHMRLLLDKLVYPPAQLDLFADNRQAQRRQQNLMAALDRIRAQFGARAIQVGRMMAA